MTPEFSRPVPVARIKPAGSTEKISATADELAALARRFNLPAISQLSAHLTVHSWQRGGVRVRGSVNAGISQVCVVSLDTFDTTISAELDRCFAPAGAPGGEQGITQLVSLDDDDAPDVLAGDSIDLGEIAAEALGLALDPYPKKPGAIFKNDDASDPGEPHESAEKSPFSVLSGLARKQ